MDKTAHLRSSADITGHHALLHGEGYILQVDSLPPLRGVHYPPSSIQDAGWFDRPVYFVDERDGTPQVFCWSLSTYTGDVIHYLWRVYRDYQFELVLGFGSQFQQAESLPFSACGYLFDAVTADSRAVWRAVKPEPLKLFTPSHTRLALFREPQPEWFGSTNLAFNFSLAVQHRPHPPQDPARQVADTISHDVPGCCVNLAQLSLSSIPTPVDQCSDSSSDASVATDGSGLHISDLEDSPWDSPQYFSIDEDDHMILIIPGFLENRKDVKKYLNSALKHLDKRIREVKCSICKDKHRKKPVKANKLWDVKPSNLERHILTHFGIKEYLCSICGAVFTTKDQEKKHAKKRHSEQNKANTQVSEGQEASGYMVQDMYAATHLTTTGFLPGLEPLGTDPAIQAEYMSLNTSYHSNF